MRLKTKSIKLIIWFLIAIILDLTVTHKIRIFNAKPMLTHSLIVSTMISEDRFSAAMIIAFVVSLVCASLLMQNFAFEVIFIMIAAVAIFSLGRKIRYIPGFIVSGVFSAVFAVVHILLSNLISSGIASLYGIGNILIANTIYTFIVAMGVHLLFCKDVYGMENNKFRF